ncbi:MAG TPA: ANTAR domain-containing protein [Jatrophihabitans sp.]|jgi:AmiR/NasT family two-component response regulator
MTGVSESSVDVFGCEADLDGLRAELAAAQEMIANLKIALATSRRIGQALGILMCAHKITEAEAFAMLRSASQHQHVKIKDLAEDVVLTGTLAEQAEAS